MHMLIEKHTADKHLQPADRFASKKVSFFFALLFFYPTFFDTVYIYICILSVCDNCGIVAGSAAKVVPLEILR